MQIQRANGAWTIVLAAQKLAWRARLPGAFGFDQAAHALRCARGAGLSSALLLPSALAASWLVNNRVPSTTFQKWLQPPLRGCWDELLALLEGGADSWLARTTEERTSVAACARTLCVDGHGVAGLSKAAAVLVPETVPLMDDAALWFAGEWAKPVDTAEKPLAGSEPLLPMLDWFSRSVLAAESALVDLAREHRDAVLDAAQVLDRLLWFESWGYRLTHTNGNPGERYWWVTDGEREAIVPVNGPHPAMPAGARVSIAEVQDPAWVQRVRAGLDVAFAQA